MDVTNGKNKASKFTEKIPKFFKNENDLISLTRIVLKDFQLEVVGDLPRYYNGPDSCIQFYCDFIDRRIPD